MHTPKGQPEVFIRPAAGRASGRRSSTLPPEPSHTSEGGRRAARRLSLGVVVLMIVASTGGLAVPDMYRDNPFVTAGWHANDAVTLLAAVPVLVWALTAASAGSARGFLVWMGMIWFAMYNYAFYLFGAAYNRLFLVYALLFTFSVAALVFGLASADLERITRRSPSPAPHRWIAGYMLLVALCLAGLHLSMAVNYLLRGQLPGMMVIVNHPTSLVAALDLSLVVPLNLLGGWWLWRRQRWGIVLAAIANVWGVAYMAVLSAATVWTVRSGVAGDLSFLGLWAAIGIGCLTGSVALLRSIGSHGHAQRDGPMLVGV